MLSMHCCFPPSLIEVVITPPPLSMLSQARLPSSGGERESGNGIFVMEKRARCLCPCFAVILSVYPRSMLYRRRRDKGPPRRVFMEQTIPNQDQLSLSVSLPWWGLFLIQACRENTPLVSKDSRREYVHIVESIKLKLTLPDG